jgi:hypothetical protein
MRSTARVVTACCCPSTGSLTRHASQPYPCIATVQLQPSTGGQIMHFSPLLKPCLLLPPNRRPDSTYGSMTKYSSCSTPSTAAQHWQANHSSPLLAPCLLLPPNRKLHKMHKATRPKYSNWIATHHQLQQHTGRPLMGEYVTWTFSPNNNGIAHQGRAG